MHDISVCAAKNCGNFILSDLSSASVCSSHTRKRRWRRRRDSEENRAARIVSLGYRAPPKKRGVGPWFGWGPRPTIARARSFHSFLSFIRSFTEKIHEPERSAGLQDVLGRTVNVRIMRTIGTRDPLNVPFFRFKIRNRYDLTNKLQFSPCLFFEKKNVYIYIYFLRFYRQD